MAGPTQVLSVFTTRISDGAGGESEHSELFCASGKVP